MNENVNQIQEINQEQSQVQEKKVKIYYYLHNDGLESKYKLPLLIKVGDKIFNGFIKCRTSIYASSIDMYYIFSENIYVKLWLDRADNILIYISSVKDVSFFLDGTGEVINVDSVSYDKEDNVVRCGNKIIKLEGFSLIEDLEKIESELIEPVLAVVCTKLVS